MCRPMQTSACQPAQDEVLAAPLHVNRWEGPLQYIDEGAASEREAMPSRARALRGRQSKAGWPSHVGRWRRAPGAPPPWLVHTHAHARKRRTHLRLCGELHRPGQRHDPLAHDLLLAHALACEGEGGGAGVGYCRASSAGLPTDGTLHGPTRIAQGADISSLTSFSLPPSPPSPTRTHTRTHAHTRTHTRARMRLISTHHMACGRRGACRR